MYQTRSGVQLTLASQSPRRQEILSSLGLTFQIAPSGVDEGPKEETETPEHYALRLAREKGEAVAKRFSDSFVLAADTVVALNGEIFGKPLDESDARKTLSLLSGSTHQVIGGFVLIDPGGTSCWSRASLTEVTFRSISEEELSSYLALEEYRDKAGSYGVQGAAQAFVRSVSGSYTNVVGLDSQLVLAALLEHRVAEVVV